MVFSHFSLKCLTLLVVASGKVAGTTQANGQLGSNNVCSTATDSKCGDNTNNHMANIDMASEGLSLFQQQFVSDKSNKNVRKTHRAQKSLGKHNVQKSLGKHDVHKSLGKHNVQKSLGKRNARKSWGKRHAQKSLAHVQVKSRSRLLWANPYVQELFAAGGDIHAIIVGANDGDSVRTNDPVYDALSNTNVKALMVEPNPPIYKILVRNLQKFQQPARLQPLNFAICPDKKGTVPFYVVSPHFREKFPNAAHFATFSGISSMNKTHLLKHWQYLKGQVKSQKEFEAFIDEIQVPCQTPSDLMTRDNFKPQQVDLLMVDVEGFDAKVVTSFMAQKAFKPKIIIFEHLHLSRAEYSNVQTLLRHRGYAISATEDGNTLARLQ